MAESDDQLRDDRQDAEARRPLWHRPVLEVLPFDRTMNGASAVDDSPSFPGISFNS